MTTTEQKIESLKKTINLMSGIARNIMTDDLEEIDALNRAISDASSDLFELELSLQPATDELALVA